LLQSFASCTCSEEKYQKIIELGRALPSLDPKYKNGRKPCTGLPEPHVLHSEMKDGVLFFELSSDALISQGLGALLILAYNGEKPEVVLKCPPHHIDELGMHRTLTPGRANGLASLYLRLKQEALRFYIAQQKSV